MVPSAAAIGLSSLRVADALARLPGADGNLLWIPTGVRFCGVCEIILDLKSLDYSGVPLVMEV